MSFVVLDAFMIGRLTSTAECYGDEKIEMFDYKEKYYVRRDRVECRKDTPLNAFPVIIHAEPNSSLDALRKKKVVNLTKCV